MKDLLNNFGGIPKENSQKKRMRIHQGWWRRNVLNKLPGLHPIDANRNICNTILDGEETKANFLSQNSINAVLKTLKDHSSDGMGIIEEDRLYNNLLSSQPLCFNFFGELMADNDFGLIVLQSWWPELTELKEVLFEFAPKERYTNDNSAFDIAFKVAIGNKTGLIGLECKYTDNFSAKEYDKSAYRDIYTNSNSFLGDYDTLKSSKFNQLFRNQLIVEALIQNKKYDFIKTGLFCYEHDKEAIETGNNFATLLSSKNFQVITYRDFIANIQTLDLDWNKREWSMLLWARYCATVLSDTAYNALNE